jgi:regulator of protease activity HflC (stomatin/prohibitin superfamily)
VLTLVLSVVRVRRLADGMDATVFVIAVLAGLTLVGLMLSVRIVQQYERGVVFRLGRVRDGARPAGLTLIVPIIDRLQKVNVQVVTMSVPAQDSITADNVSVRVDAVVYFRVIDAIKAMVNVQNYPYAVSQIAQTSLRSVIGRADLDALLSERDRLNAELTAIIDGPTELPWGIKIERVEVKDVALPETMKRSMSRQAEAERERRARIITADGELQASTKLAQAATAMSATPAALQLRLLQTVVEVGAEKNSTLVMPIPVELLRFFDRLTPQSQAVQPHAAQTGHTHDQTPLPNGPATPVVPATRAPLMTGQPEPIG